MGVLNQNTIESVQVTLEDLPNTLNNIIKQGAVVTRVVKNGFDEDGKQLVFVAFVSLIRG